MKCCVLCTCIVPEGELAGADSQRPHYTTSRFQKSERKDMTRRQETLIQAKGWLMPDFSMSHYISHFG
jgi:hypothetical protein